MNEQAKLRAKQEVIAVRVRREPMVLLGPAGIPAVGDRFDVPWIGHPDGKQQARVEVLAVELDGLARAYDVEYLETLSEETYHALVRQGTTLRHGAAEGGAALTGWSRLKPYEQASIVKTVERNRRAFAERNRDDG